MSAALVAALVLGPAPVAAEVTAGIDGRTSVYQDTDKTFISTSIVSAKISPRDVITLSGHYLADIITSASVDVTTSASTAFHETRHEGQGGIAYADGTRTATIGYVYSKENDWRSHSVSAGFSHDFLSHILTIGIGGSFTANTVGRACSTHPQTAGTSLTGYVEKPACAEGVVADPSFHRALNQGSASLDVGVVASRRDLVTLDYTFMYLSGYQASPYRFVCYVDPDVTPKGTKRPSVGCGPLLSGAVEAYPTTRVRHAFALRWNHHAFKDTAIKSHARLYRDDWGVTAGTAGTEYVVGFGDFELAPFVRGYVQTGAAFYQSTYDSFRRYMTSDRELSPFIDAFGGLRFAWQREHVGPFGDLHAEVKGTAFAFHFFDFPRLENRQGLIGELAFGGTL